MAKSKPKKKTGSGLDSKEKLVKDIKGIALITLGILFFVSIYTKLVGSFGTFTSAILKRGFGISAVCVALILIIFGMVLISEKEKKSLFKIANTYIIFVILLDISIFIASGYDSAVEKNITYSEIARLGLLQKNGGVIPTFFARIIIGGIGKVGLQIVLLAIIVALLPVLFNRTISEVMSNAREKSKTIDKERKDNKRKRDAEREAQGDQLSIRDLEPTEEERQRARDEILDDNKKRKILGYVKNFGKRDDNADDLPPFYDEEPEAEEDVKEDLYDEPQMSQSPEVYDAPEPEGSSEITRIPAMPGAGGVAMKRYKFPPISLLNKPLKKSKGMGTRELNEKAMLLEDTLKSFNVSAKVTNVTQGPAVIKYEVEPKAGVKVSSIVRLGDDIALNLRAKSIRIEAPIPGKAAVGIEIENDEINMVGLRDIISSPEFKNAESKITFSLGRDISGKAIVADLKSMPHLLIAGATGSGKSVCINSIITSFLYKASPEDVKLLLIDPKVIELSAYNSVPHLLMPVLTDPTKATGALTWAVAEMGERYKKFAGKGAKDLASYNSKMAAEGLDKLPQIVIIIDELADLMMAAPSQVEDSICRIAQMARAAGMHLIVATQRPSVDVITGVIKANIPSRIAFAVSSQFDSRTILDHAGAEKLVGKGDMLFHAVSDKTSKRIQGAFISETEVANVIAYVAAQGKHDSDYAKNAREKIETHASPVAPSDDSDDILNDAVEFCRGCETVSTSRLQREFRIGYNRAARLIDDLEVMGVVGPRDGSKPRLVLISDEDEDVDE